MNGIRALLFDIDGIILDTREFILQAAEHALKTRGYPVPERSAIAKLVGRPFDEFYSILSGSKEVLPLQNAHREFQLSNFDLATPYPRTTETLHALRDRGFKLAAVTSRSKKTSLETLRRAGIQSIFSAIISGEDVLQPKPHPEALLKALEALREEPKTAVMIGDSYLDIEAGKRAGTKTIRATYGFHTERLHEPAPDFIIHDIADLPGLF